MLEKVLATTQYVIQQSREVKINQSQIKILANNIKTKPVPSWNKTYHFQGSPEQVIQYLFWKDSLDFSLWPDSGKAPWTYHFNGKKITGYFALAIALKKACQNNFFLEADYLAQITKLQFKKIIDPLGHLPLLSDRLAILQKNAQILHDKFQGQAANIIKTAHGHPSSIIKTLALNFPSFNDCTVYQGQTIFFFKRAQIFIADTWAALNGKGLGEIKELSELTCFADNRLPQVLRHYGVLEYSENLTNLIKLQKPLESGSNYEAEIRANTIWAVELLRQELRLLGKELLPLQIDWILWNLAHKIKLTEPAHRTRTIFY